MFPILPCFHAPCPMPHAPCSMLRATPSMLPWSRLMHHLYHFVAPGGARLRRECSSSGKSIAVDPYVSPNPLPVNASSSSSSPPTQPTTPLPESLPHGMEIDSRPSHPPVIGGSPHYGRLERHRVEPGQQQPLQQVEVNRQAPSLPPASALRSPSAPLNSFSTKSPSNPPIPSPAVKPMQDAQYAHPPPPPPTAPPKEGSAVGVANRTRELPPVTTQTHSHPDHYRVNGHHFPRSPKDVSLDAIERLQTQVSQNSSALMVQARDMRRFEETAAQVEKSLRHDFQTQLHLQAVDIRRVDDAVARLQHEMRGMRDLCEALTREVQASRDMYPGPTGPSSSTTAPSAQDTALEMMAQQISSLSRKTSEVDTLKLTIEIMKNKIQRLEESAVSTPPVPTHAFPSPRENPAHPPHAALNRAPFRAAPSAVPASAPQVETSMPPSHRPASFNSHGSHSNTTPELPHRTELPQAPSGWVSVNSSAKRAQPDSVDVPHDPSGQQLGSPKRPKLAPIEPRLGYGNSQTPSQSQHVYDQVEPEDMDARRHTHHAMPSQAHVRETNLDAGHVASHVPHGTFVSFNAPDTRPNDNWRSEIHPMAEQHTPRSRGRGGGPGSRGGRGRKSMPAQMHIGTPVWDRDDWQGVTDPQTSPEGYYYPISRTGRGIIRRGSGGGGTSRGGRPSSSSSRSVSLGLQGVTSGIGMVVDPYSHTKKTRTKPTRNSDGVLIRKDGRPDMRSQSSAANLRKVHARKDDQGFEHGFTPTNLHHSVNTEESDTRSPTEYTPPHQDDEGNVQEKHHAIMGKMFPGGIEESRKEHDLARRVFEEGEQHTAESRTHHHHHHHGQQQQQQQQQRDRQSYSPDRARQMSIKREHHDSVQNDRSQSSNDEDIDMDRPRELEEDQTPSRQSDNSNQYQYHDLRSRQGRSQGPQDSGITATESNTGHHVQSSQVLEGHDLA
ncbi:hypothetical protein BU24DRAFT_414300 [Aaosphaeria arxii CBS 175.79]|uniref:Uncharacterized protein n=1 Tax=Aaosphaeria arxii CBS 175.79 TaxID=1450172 RepID=A0A6A5XAA3_9PLEO|nr:uncharacterized protein BU24DRAFT_414300 [Aaosphaeria arxii CBS 175.79]KAF2009839.1 hypothetical protein BU24DRAFT_414300 [Aaosphaeria arxii CBS 175.79]